jgi:two-component system, response regulator RegA
MDTKHILIVEDDTLYCKKLGQAFSARGIATKIAFSIPEAEELIKNENFTHAVFDLKVGSEFSLSLLEKLVKNQGTAIIILTGYGSVPSALEAVRLGALNYICKPCSFEQIFKALFGQPLEPTVTNVNMNVSLDELKWDHISRVLHEHNGNITRAAKALGIHRQALQRKIKNK